MAASISLLGLPQQWSWGSSSSGAEARRVWAVRGVEGEQSRQRAEVG